MAAASSADFGEADLFDPAVHLLPVTSRPYPRKNSGKEKEADSKGSSCDSVSS